MVEMRASLERVAHDNGVVTLQSPLLRGLGLVHGFSTRIGGVSEGPFASLNLGSLAKGGDSDANTAVAENFRRLRAALGCARMPRVVVRQVHGAGTWVVPAQLVLPHEAPEADAMVTAERDRLLTIRVADCVPVLLAGSSVDGRRVVAAVHAGWRGVVAGVVPATLETLRERFGVEPGDVVAAVGPCIGPEHFEVGPEVVEQFERVDLGETVLPAPAAPVASNGDRPRIDLARAVHRQLQRAGVAPRRIDATDHCTHRDRDLFFSYRRDGARSGRLAAVIAIA